MAATAPRSPRAARSFSRDLRAPDQCGLRQGEQALRHDQARHDQGGSRDRLHPIDLAQPGLAPTHPVGRPRPFANRTMLAQRPADNCLLVIGVGGFGLGPHQDACQQAHARPRAARRRRPEGSANDPVPLDGPHRARGLQASRSSSTRALTAAARPRHPCASDARIKGSRVGPPGSPCRGPVRDQSATGASMR